MNYKKLLEDNRDNIELLKDLAREVISYDGSLDWLDVQEFDDEFFDTYFEGKPMEAARATHFGEVNWSDDYIRFNGYGNLETLSDYAYDKEIEESTDEIIENALRLIEDGNIDIDWILEHNDIEESSDGNK